MASSYSQRSIDRASEMGNSLVTWQALVAVILCSFVGCAEAGKGDVISEDAVAPDWAGDNSENDLGTEADTADTAAETVTEEPEIEQVDVSSVETIAVSGKSLDILGQNPVAGLQVCVFERVDLPCGESDADGVYTVPQVPSNAEISLTFHKESYFPELIMVKTGGEDMTLAITSAHATREQADIILKITGQVEDPQRGHLGLAVFQQNANNSFIDMIDGASFEMDKDLETEPIYLNDGGLPDPGRSVTSTNARAFVFNVEPGEIIVTLKHDEWKNCSVGAFGWPAEGPAAIRMRVVPGYVSAGVFLCVPTP